MKKGKGVRIYYYYHEESDTIFSKFSELDWDQENPDGCIIPVSRERAIGIMKEHGEHYIENFDVS